MPTPRVGASWVNRAWTDGSGLNKISSDDEVVLVDPADISKEDMDELHAAGHYLLCYNNAGAWESWRADADEFPLELRARKLAGWDNEYWWNIIEWDDSELKNAHIKRMKWMWEKGCDGLELDNLDCRSCVDGESKTDLRAKAVENVRWLAQESNRQCMDASMKNSIDIFADVAEHFQMAVNEQCEEYNECSSYIDYFIDLGKPVFAVEYTKSWSEADCSFANNNGISRKYFDESSKYQDC
ncbi:hypothetical protein SARC_11210 [Sphaeroforma arctica JP610]|uniref:Glycoside-hydrolase family GH114 TIM-barrel domain-containing protein n=1 Tax=Sphaeroforma arctica JP610 TaxID=667725 RepID=A0A0L0FHQ0_9EUKA|nr:hypothetical protein SARC_11210 [Sphaeroforma arctica JP610]KNC76280.1 hypothetical protein SARC_11210 [Sphaeroforma arctica JP610]|eukprot:XP_014150182.1 hypothetical protein SARC_11210 [Sphaeroforma arctica JP610]